MRFLEIPLYGFFLLLMIESFGGNSPGNATDPEGNLPSKPSVALFSSTPENALSQLKEAQVALKEAETVLQTHQTVLAQTSDDIPEIDPRVEDFSDESKDEIGTAKNLVASVCPRNLRSLASVSDNAIAAGAANGASAANSPVLCNDIHDVIAASRQLVEDLSQYGAELGSNSVANPSVGKSLGSF